MNPRCKSRRAIRMLRQRGGMSQRQLALRMGVPRTYVSKIENQKATPTLSSLERLARALEVSVPDLLRACGPSREEQIDELLADPFLAELAECASQLDAMQLSSVLAQVRDMVAHPRRYSSQSELRHRGFIKLHPARSSSSPAMSS